LKLDSFNSLSRDHEFVFETKWPVPLGRRTFNSLSRDHEVTSGDEIRPDEKLSTPSLGITLFQHERKVEEVDFQLPLSGSPVDPPQEACKGAMCNIFQLPLSGSHRFSQMGGLLEGGEVIFQLPLSGSLKTERAMEGFV